MFALRKFLIQVSGALLLFASFMAQAIAAAPTVTDAHISISGASGTGGAFKIGDTVTATWNNTAGGDNNSDTITSVTVDFSQFGGGSAVSATNSSGIWTATYVLMSGAIDTTSLNVSVTVTSGGGSVTVPDTTRATVDNIVPTVTDARISISGATGTGGAYKIGDTVTATWNNTASGDNNSDTISSVRVNFSQFGGGAAVSASNSSGTWTAVYTIVAGAIDATNRNITITAQDNAGNETTSADTSNARVDNIAPFVSSITPAGGAVSSDTAVDFIVDFSEAVINVSTDDFIRVATGSAAGTIASVSASSGDPVTVTLGSISGSGTLKVNLDGSTNIVDDAGNSIAAYSGGTTHTVNILTAPDAPTIGAATAGDGQVSVAFTAPASNGGSAITGYTVTSNPGGITGGGNSFTTSPITVSGLTNGTAYTFTVTATNAIGTSTSSGASGSATPMANQTITFANPGSQNFGTTPTLGATSTSGLTVVFSSSTTGVCTITSGGVLTFVTAGTCTIDADQTGNASTNAAPTVTRTFTVNASVPGAPTIGTATPGDTQADVAFIAPASNGGATITGYTVTSNPGGFTGTGAGSPITVTSLTNGISYTFTVTATNSAGTGGASGASNSITPASPQVITFANPGAQTFGTSPDLGAGVSSSSGLAVAFTSSTTGVCTITGPGVLTFIATGTCTINANQAGDSTYLPAPPVTRSFTVNPANQTITFTNPGAQSFGASPTLSASSTSGLAVTFSSSTTGVCTITSGGVLTFVTAGSCTINAHQAGNTTTNAAMTVSRTFTVNATVPGAPTIGSATAGDTQANVSFIAPASNGGATITGYTVTSNPGGFTGTGAGSPITVTGLTNGVSYTFTVTATNVAGTGGASGMSNSITPASPQIITFANPGAQSFGTAPDLSILGGGASSTSGLTVSFTSSTTGVCTITSGGVLTFVSAGTCTINANQAGNSQYLPASQVSRSFTVIPSAPDAPTIGTAIAGDTQASVAFTAPANTGGTTVTGYTVTVSPADVAPVNGASSPIVVSGLTNGQAYTFTVTADNSAGTGAASSASNSVTPKATQVITFNNPGAQNFGTTPTLIASSDSGLAPVFSSSTTGVCTIAPTGTVSFVTTGTCTIVAEQAGNGSYLAATPVSRSFPVNSVLPGAPTIGTASLIASGVIEVDFTAPDHTGGSAINGYVVSSIPGGLLAHGSSSPIQVSGLIPGTAYAFTVAASNAMGTGIPSAASNSVVAGTALVVAPVSANVAYGTATPIVPVISGNATAVNVVVAPLHGSVQINGLGFIYTPQTGFSGADSFSYSASDAYGTSPAALVSLTVEAGEQAISAFVATPAAPVYALGGSFSVSATGGASGNPVIFASSTPTVCAVAGTTVSMLAAGNCGLTADQAGNALYAAAARVVLDVVIAQGMPQLSWVADMSRTQGEGPFELPVPQSTSSGTFSYASSNTAVATVSGRTVTLVGEGTTILVATQAATSNFAAASVQVQLTVNGRPDPTRDVQVSGGLQAQVDASVRFAQVQGDNIHSRLRQLRTGSNASNVDFALAYAGSRGVPGLTLPVGGVADAVMPTLPAGWGMWLAGTATFGTVGRNGHSSGSFDFNTGGITLGADRALGESLLLGLAGSWGKQGTDFDGTSSKVDADQRSLAAYGLWRVGEHVFVDGLLANGQLDFDLTRWSDVANANAQGVREGEQWFGALTLGYEHRASEGLTLTGYGRYDAQRSRLDAYREQGLGMFDLAYGKQTVDTRALAVGLEGSHTLVGERSRWRPFWGVEYRQSLDNRSDAAMNYVQGPQASDYVLAMRSYNDDLLSLEAGMDLQLDSGWMFSLSLGREQGRNSLRSNSIGLSVRYGQSSAAVPMYGEEAASGLQGGERAGCPALSMRCAPSPLATP